MWELYLEWVKKFPEILPATERQYRDTFNNCFNISFFKPKKDRCNICNNFENAQMLTDKSSDLYLKIQNKYNDHMVQKEKAREIKENCKQKFLKAPESERDKISVFCFDYQKNLPIPKSETNAFYYKRKLGVYNFTVYDIGRHQAVCYCYDQTICSKGSCEVGSLILHYMSEKISTGITSFESFADNCGGQNRNRFVFALFVYAAQAFPKFSLTHTFLECGHTQNEGDSVHAGIEARTKNKDIFTPQMWYECIRTAKRIELHRTHIALLR